MQPLQRIKRMKVLRQTLWLGLFAMILAALISEILAKNLSLAALIVAVGLAIPIARDQVDKGLPGLLPRKKANPMPYEGAKHDYLNGMLKDFDKERDLFVPLSGDVLIKLRLEALGSDSTSQNYADILKASEDHERFVLVGESGAGKSTLLKRLFVAAANRYLTKADTDYAPLPIWINLGDSRNPPDAEDLLSNFWHEHGFTGDAQTTMNNAAVWLFMDGLNEMPEEQASRADRAKLLKKLLHDHERVRTAITCRIGDYKDALDLDSPVQLRVHPMDTAQIEQFVRGRLKDGASGLLDTMKNNATLQEIGSNAYTLALLTDVYRNPNWQDFLKTPNLNELYKFYVEQRYKDDAQKHTLELSWPVLEKRLQHLAFRMIADGKGTTADLGWAQRRIGRRALHDGESLGVMVLDRGQRSVRFFHQSLHGYFALPGLTHALEQHWYDYWYDRVFGSRRHRFITGIWDLGIAAVPAIPALIVALKDKNYSIRTAAAEALGRIGTSEAVPTLTTMLKDKGSDKRQIAIETLRQIGTPESVSVLIAAWKELGEHGSESVHHNTPEELLAALEQQDQDGSIRSYVLDALGEIDRPEAVPALVAALKDANGVVRNTAAKALGTIGAPESVPALLALIKDGDRDVRDAVALVFGEMSLRGTIGTRLTPAVPLFMAALKDEDRFVRGTAAWLLGKIGTREAIPMFLTLIEDEDIELRSTAVWALGKIGAREAIPMILMLIKDNDKRVRGAAAEALGELGISEAIPALIAALEQQNEDKDVRRTAAKSLGRIGGPQAVPALSMALKDYWGVGYAAAEALGEIGTPEAAPALVAALNVDYAGISGKAQEALRKIGPLAIPALTIALKDTDKDVRLRAAWMLGEIGAPEATPALTAALKDGDSDMRNAVTGALEEIRKEKG